MARRWVYLVLSIAGTIIPMTQFLPWARLHGSAFKLFSQELFATRISSFVTLDLLLAFVTVLFFAFSTRKRVRLWWLPVLVCLCIGISAGLPLLLFLAEQERVARPSGMPARE